jgi:hypothetical protein
VFDVGFLVVYIRQRGCMHFYFTGQRRTPAGWVILKTKQALGISQRL